MTVDMDIARTLREEDFYDYAGMPDIELSDEQIVEMWNRTAMPCERLTVEMLQAVPVASDPHLCDDFDNDKIVCGVSPADM